MMERNIDQGAYVEEVCSRELNEKVKVSIFSCWWDGAWTNFTVSAYSRDCDYYYALPSVDSKDYNEIIAIYNSIVYEPSLYEDLGDDLPF